MQLNQEGEKFYFGAVLSNSVDDMLVIPFFEIAEERFLEYDLTKSIYNLANTEKPVIGLISGLPFSGGISNEVNNPSYEEPFYLYQNISEFYNIINLTQNFESIPEDVQQLYNTSKKFIRKCFIQNRPICFRRKGCYFC